jgi:hypothetical protein
MLAEKKIPVFSVERTKPQTEQNIASEKKANVIPMPASSSSRNLEKVSSKGYISAPKHDFL